MKQWYVLAYDIREPRRLKRVHYYLKKQALPLQKSVFIVHCSANQLADILNEVRERASLGEDDIRLYPVSSPQSLWAAGQQAKQLHSLYQTKTPNVTTHKNWLKQASYWLFG
jgi:CRISPR-associated protein Cas2